MCSTKSQTTTVVLQTVPDTTESKTKKTMTCRIWMNIPMLKNRRGTKLQCRAPGHGHIQGHGQDRIPGRGHD